MIGNTTRIRRLVQPSYSRNYFGARIGGQYPIFVLDGRVKGCRRCGYQDRDVRLAMRAQAVDATPFNRSIVPFYSTLANGLGFETTAIDFELSVASTARTYQALTASFGTNLWMASALLCLFPNLPYQFLHIKGESSTANAGLHSDHREGRCNLENNIIWFAVMQPRRDQSPRLTHEFQHSYHRYSDENRTDICSRAANTFIKIEADRGMFSGNGRLRISLHCPDSLKICGINGRDWIVLRFSVISKIIDNRRHGISDIFPTCSATVCYSIQYSGLTRQLA